MSFEFESSSPVGILATLAAGTVFKLVAGYLIGSRKSEEYRLVGHVSALYCYPFKSFRGMLVDEAECTPLGLRCFGVTDRHWAVASAGGRYVSQSMKPKMALIAVTVKSDLVQLDAPGMEPFTLPVNPPVTEDRLSKVTVLQQPTITLDCGDEVAEWLCRYFDSEGLRLHYSAPSLGKQECAKHQKNYNHPAKPGVDFTALSNYCSYMMLGESSLEALNKRLANPVSITNFRPNVVVGGCLAFEEDGWIGLRIGNAELRALHCCTRCPLTTVDQEKGVKDKDEEPLATLKKFRVTEPYAPKPTFGVYFALDRPGIIKVGDPIYAKYGQHQISARHG